MFIEIMGTDFSNKGAELMLLSVIQETRRRFPKASFVVAPKSKDDYLRRAELGLWQKAWLLKYGIQWGKIGRLVAPSVRRRFGLIIDDEIEVVLDASGFSYSDQWGERPTVQMATYVKKWKRHGTKIILLPQALGPFTSAKIRKAFSYIVDNADLICPRDDISFDHIKKLSGNRDNIFKAPDFTNLLSGDIPDDPDKYRDRYCLIPNYRMIDRTQDYRSAIYPDFCAKCLKVLINKGLNPFILIHEGDKDAQLAEIIINKVGKSIEIVRETNALKIKGILGLCAGVISSRFHGLVNALSQGVPSLVTGWSHKYEMLLKEYGVPDAYLPVNISDDELNQKIDKITNQRIRKKTKDTINEANIRIRQETKDMWNKVFSVIMDSSDQIKSPF